MNRTRRFAISVVYIVVLTIVVLLIARCASAQSGNVIGNVGYSSAGLGSQAGPTAGIDLDVSKNKWEAINRFTLDFSDKTTGSGHSISERFIVRYGTHWKFGAGLGINYVTADFGSRSTLSPLGHLAYDYRKERYRVVPYVTGRWSKDNHSTRGIEAGIELYQVWGRLITKESAGVEALWFHDFGLTTTRQQAYGFVRAGVGVTF